MAEIKADENLPSEVATAFREAGHDCHTVWDEQLQGSPDVVIAERCRAENRVLVTLDLDFANILSYPPGSHPGMIVLRPHSADPESILRVLSRVMQELAVEQVDGSLWICDDSTTRVRAP